MVNSPDFHRWWPRKSSGKGLTINGNGLESGALVY